MQMAIITSYVPDAAYGLLGPQMAATIIQDHTRDSCIVIAVTRDDDKASLKKALSDHKAFAGKPLYSAPVRVAQRPVWEIFTAAFPRGLRTPENAACKECRHMGMPSFVLHNEHT